MKTKRTTIGQAAMLTEVDPNELAAVAGGFQNGLPEAIHLLVQLTQQLPQVLGALGIGVPPGSPYPVKPL